MRDTPRKCLSDSNGAHSIDLHRSNSNQPSFRMSNLLPYNSSRWKAKRERQRISISIWKWSRSGETHHGELLAIRLCSWEVDDEHDSWQKEVVLSCRRGYCSFIVYFSLSYFYEFIFFFFFTNEIIYFKRCKKLKSWNEGKMESKICPVCIRSNTSILPSWTTHWFVICRDEGRQFPSLENGF